MKMLKTIVLTLMFNQITKQHQLQHYSFIIQGSRSLPRLSIFSNKKSMSVFSTAGLLMTQRKKLTASSSG